MEFDELGTQCALTSCRQHDFLPFTCHQCQRRFCAAHHRNHDGCSTVASAQRVPLVCKTCAIVIQVVADDCPTSERAAHIAAHDCSKARQKSMRCQHPGCRTRPLVRIECRTCSKRYCFSHRSELDHECALRVSTPASMKVPKSSSALSSLPPLVGYTNSPVAPRGDVKLDGDLRAYCEIELDGKRTFWFFNRRWSVAKVLDTIAPGQRSKAIADGSALSPLDMIGSLTQHSHIKVLRDAGSCSEDAKEYVENVRGRRTSVY
jgi:AN1-type zinc finger protein 2